MIKILLYFIITYSLFPNVRIYEGKIHTSEIEFQIEYNFDGTIKNAIYAYSDRGIPIIFRKNS
ncbi:hypothetical protein [Fusobacterium sp.]|uniref:hypothetical protein n=1 Tax=Fusobacterium sp. TaxID=68766 RepID=UPI0028FEB0C4|nr:hypothetical protein [Fusobacterium sp.]MDU1909618.1 hypothetical protein [Fusobacterium sp.]